jgi:hypothetical protein
LKFLAKLPHALAQARPHGQAPLVCRNRHAPDEIGDQCPALVQIPAKVPPFAHTHDVEVGQGLTDDFPGVRRQRFLRRFVGLIGRCESSACGSRRRSPGVRVPATNPRVRALSMACSSAAPNVSLNSTSMPGDCRT